MAAIGQVCGGQDAGDLQLRVSWPLDVKVPVQYNPPNQVLFTTHFIICEFYASFKVSIVSVWSLYNMGV